MTHISLYVVVKISFVKVGKLCLEPIFYPEIDSSSSKTCFPFQKTSWLKSGGSQMVWGHECMGDEQRFHDRMKVYPSDQHTYCEVGCCFEVGELLWSSMSRLCALMEFHKICRNEEYTPLNVVLFGRKTTITTLHWSLEASSCFQRFGSELSLKMVSYQA